MNSTLKERIRKRIEELRLIEKIEEEELRNERKEENNKRHEDIANEELDSIDSSQSIEIDNLDTQLNTNSQEMEGSSPSTEESTNKAKEQKSASPTSFLDYTDDDDDDNDDDDDVDDDLIHTAPVLLKSIQEITSRPSPEPKLQNLNSSIDSSYSSPLSQKSDIVKTNMKSKFCLDNLLTDHTEMKEFEKICNEVKTDMKNDGAFINMLNKEDEEKVEEVDLGEEKRLILKQMTEVEEEMPEDRPGVKVMDLDQTCSMFDESIHPCHCGFTIGENASTTELHIHGITRERYLMLVESDILSMCFARITCQDQLMRWLFFLMSVDDNFLVRQGCRKSILKIIHQQQVKGTRIWSPTVYDFITILCNYGAALQMLLPKQFENEFNTIELGNQMFKQPNRQSDSAKRKANEQLVKEKLEMTLEVIGSTLLKNREAHPAKELSLYIAVICRMSLDPLFKDMYGVRILQDSIDLLIENYSEQDWQTQRIQLIRMLSKISDHHHDMTYICKLLPVGARGLYVQRRVAYLTLSSLLLNKKVDDSQLQDFTIKDLYQFVPSMLSLLNDDLYYKLSSMIVLMDLCVASNHSISSQDREDLKRLIELVKKVRVKENVALMNRSKINDILVRTTSGWTLDIQTFKGKQTKIYEYACYKSPVKYRIEQLEQHKSDSSEASDNDGDDNDDDDQPVPTKLPKLDMVS